VATDRDDTTKELPVFAHVIRHGGCQSRVFLGDDPEDPKKGIEFVKRTKTGILSVTHASCRIFKSCRLLVVDE
jgi:hypothetical protein